MDPASAIIGIASGAAGLVALTAQVVTYLVGLRDSYQNSDLTILDLISTCQAYRTAWSHIEQWASDLSHHAYSRDSTATLSELKSFLEAGQVVMNLMQRDINRLLSKHSIWRRASTTRKRRDALGLLLHRKAIADHAARIHRQNTSLNLLISILTLPSRPLQQAAVDVLRPKFRKDEETAWTIVNPKSSSISRRRQRTNASSRTSIDSSFSVGQHNEDIGLTRGFDFEDELFSGPVYRRLLIKRLCEQPLGKLASNKAGNVSAQPGQNSLQKLREPVASMHVPPDGRQTQATNQSHGDLAPEFVLAASPHQNCHDNDDTLALELRQQGIFSRSVHEDYCEFMECHRPRKMQRRHLPLASVRTQNQIDLETQIDLNGQFQSAIRRRDLEGAAKTLDAGAEINCYQDGQTALEFCVQTWLDTKSLEPDLPSEYTTMAEFLMLYKETYVTYMFSCGATILHLCMHIGATAEFMKPFLAIESPVQALSHLDRYGRSILRTAQLASTSGHFALTQLDKLLETDPISTDLLLAKDASDTQEAARLQELRKHVPNPVDTTQGSSKENSSVNAESRKGSEPTTSLPEGPIHNTQRRYRIFVTNPDPVEQVDDECTPDETNTITTVVTQDQTEPSQPQSDAENDSMTSSSSLFDVESQRENSIYTDISPVSTRKSMP